MQSAPRYTPTTSVRWLWPFLALARDQGSELASVAERLGLTPAELRDPNTRVAQQLLADLLSEAIEQSGVRDLGLIAASHVDSEHFGISEFIARSRPTLREALESTVQYLPLLGDGAHAALQIDGKLARLRFWFDSQLVFHDAAYEFVMAIGMLRARRTTGMKDLAPIEVCFMHPQPADISRHERIFRCPVRFKAEVTEVVMSTAGLDARMRGAEPVLDELLSRQADRMLEDLARPRQLSDRVRAELSARAELRGTSAERLARKLGMSVRTLHRKLNDEATSYREVFDQVRMTAAARRLEQGERSIAEIAHALGFSSPQSFHRAFKRWTGTTAAAHRAAAKQTRPRPEQARRGARKKR